MDERESFSSRLGFILISAGCAIGLGNVWRFPYITGKYGGAAFVLIYLLFLIILGLPVMVTELRSAGQPEEHGLVLPRSGAGRLQMALVQLSRFCGKLSTDDVLHGHSWLAALLLCQNATG